MSVPQPNLPEPTLPAPTQPELPQPELPTRPGIGAAGLAETVAVSIDHGSEPGEPDEEEAFQAISQGRALKIGEISSNVIHTPGHTEGSICLYFPLEKELIAGDTLFAGSIGRTDLPGGSFEKIIQSLHTKLLALPDETVVVPGHGPVTTIGEERESNPFLRK